MHFWNNIIQTAMLGTSKKQLAATDLNSDLADVLAVIKEQNGVDSEEQLLQLVAVAASYRFSGAMPLQNTGGIMPAAAPETYAYCSNVAMQLLKDILEEDSNTLLELWLRLCTAKQWVVQPVLIPKLLARAANHKALRTAIFFVVGNRGAWLSQFNKDWNFSNATTDEELWQTGTPEQRKQVIQHLRATDTTKALEWLQQTWKQENANTKADLLKVMATNPQSGDVEWLETLLTEKSQKVKDEALLLLKKIPASGIVQQYWGVMKQAITVGTEKTMLGLASKKVLTIALPTVMDEAIFKTGIDKLSSNKNITDEAYILYQLMAFIPPHFWEEHLQETPENILALLNKTDAGKNLTPAIGLACGRFKNEDWARLFLHSKHTFYPDLLPLVTLQEQEAYLLQHFDRAPEMAIGFLANATEEWKPSIAVKIIQFTVKNPYQYNRSFYHQHIQLLPTAIADMLDSFAPKEEYHITTWNNIKDYLRTLLKLKQETINAFQ